MSTWSASNIREAIGTDKELLRFIRVAISGQTVGPPLFESMEILGKDETLWRLRKAVKDVHEV